MKKLLHTILATLTQHPREIVQEGVDFTWSDGSSYVHDFFRVYEIFFGRRKGIRVEAELSSDGSGDVYKFFTLEARLAHFEYKFRTFLKKVLEPVPRLVMASSFGQFVPSGVLMAIAYDNSTMDANAGTNITTHTTASFTITGSNIAIVACGFGQAGSSTFPTSMKWGGSSGTSMTTCAAELWVSGAAISVSQWYIDSLSTDSKTGYVLYGTTQARIGVGLLSLSGCKSGSLGSVTTASAASGTTASKALVTSTNNSVVVSAITVNTTNATSATGTNQTQRYNTNILANHSASGSTQTTTTAGSTTSSYSWTGSAGWSMSMVEIKEYVAPTTSIIQPAFSLGLMIKI